MVERIRTCPDPARWLDRIVASASEQDGCWIWRLALDRGGYGKFSFVSQGGQRSTGAHRAAWLAFRSDIPDDLVVDHLCDNRDCVNPWHMELVSNQVNSARGDRPGSPGSRGRGHLGCRKHGLESGYNYVAPGKTQTQWVCRTCRAARRWQPKARA